MKRFLLAFLATATLFACTKGDDGGDGGNGGGNNGGGSSQPTITIDASSVPNFKTEGGSQAITFTASQAWTAEVINSRADNWCSISPTSGPAGNAKITVTTSANDTPDDRSASINIKAGSTTKTVTVNQKQKDALTVTASRFEVAAEGGEVAIEVKANIDFEYAIDEAAKEWIKYETTRAIKTSNLVFKISENDAKEKREGKITIKSGSFSEVVAIYQEGSKPSIVISKSEYVVPSAGETIAVEVKSNVDVTVELPTDIDWIKENSDRATSTNTYYFDIDENVDYDQRSAEIKFTNKENNLSEVVVVKQMQKDAIVLAKSEYEFGFYGGKLDFEVLTNVELTVTISNNAKAWIQQVESRALESKNLHFDIDRAGEENREGTITIAGGNATQTIKVKQIGADENIIRERETLIAFYNATGGKNWTNNENWCSDKPIDEWYGVSANWMGVQSIDLHKNNLTGNIPESICNLNGLTSLNLNENQLAGEIPSYICNVNQLQRLDLSWNKFTGSIPESICNLKRLTSLKLNNNQLTGEIPNYICNLNKLQILDLSSNKFSGQIPVNIGNLEDIRSLDLQWNYLTGSIPESLGNLKKATGMYLQANGLSGKVPQSVMEASYWPNNWSWIINQNPEKGGGISREGLKIPAPKFSATDIYGNTIDDSVYKNNKYTAIFYFEDWCQFSQAFMPTMVKLYNQYKEKGFEVIALSEGTKEDLLAENQLFGATWPCFDVTYDIYVGNVLYGLFFSYIAYTPCINIVNSEGYLEFISVYDSYKDIDRFLLTKLGPPDDAGEDHQFYTSTDYSKDGEVKTLQTATKGSGIDIVLMGDAFSDRLIADGTYDKVMNTAMEKLFEVEPYKSYRDHFNVHSVKVVSPNELYTEGTTTAFECYFGDGTLVGGTDSRVLSYAQKAISDTRMNEALIIVMMNSTAYAGTCYMYNPSNNTQNWGNGVSISYFPIGQDDTALAQVLHHEAGGHGFAKLADEYAYEDMGAIPEAEAASHKTQQTDWGWWKNVDFTNDPAKVRWSYFLTDTRYANEGLGAYEGGLTYWSGVWRPTENSIMRYNTGGFNAPSREAIYYRIHKLAYGADWQYDYEKFVEWDAKNRKAAAATRTIPYRRAEIRPTHPPVVINKSWKDAK